MTPDRAREILGADTCHPARPATDNPGPTHLIVSDSARRICDGRTMIAPVLADSEVPTCDRCRRAASAAARLVEREGILP